MANRIVHPGRCLQAELDELQMSISEASRRIGVPPNRLSQIVNGQRAVTADTALRLGRWFGTGPELWMNLQKTYDLNRTERDLQAELKAIKPLSGHAA